MLSITAVRAQTECLLSRLRHVGVGLVQLMLGAGGIEGGGELGKGEAGTEKFKH